MLSQSHRLTGGICEAYRVSGNMHGDRISLLWESILIEYILAILANGQKLAKLCDSRKKSATLLLGARKAAGWPRKY
jgi:hypothetical protein